MLEFKNKILMEVFIFSRSVTIVIMEEISTVRQESEAVAAPD